MNWCVGRILSELDSFKHLEVFLGEGCVEDFKSKVFLCEHHMFFIFFFFLFFYS